MTEWVETMTRVAEMFLDGGTFYSIARTGIVSERQAIDIYKTVFEPRYCKRCEIEVEDGEYEMCNACRVEVGALVA